VLERIATDPAERTSREIEALRPRIDRHGTPNGFTIFMVSMVVVVSR